MVPKPTTTAKEQHFEEQSMTVKQHCPQLLPLDRAAEVLGLVFSNILGRDGSCEIKILND